MFYAISWTKISVLAMAVDQNELENSIFDIGKNPVSFIVSHTVSHWCGNAVAQL